MIAEIIKAPRTGRITLFFHAMRSVFALYNSDYDDFYVVSKSDVDEQIKNAEQFTLAIMMFLESKGVEITK